MTYHCFRCQTPLPAGAVACPRCGHKFDAPVPGPNSPAMGTMPRQQAAPGRSRAGLWIAGGFFVFLVLIGGIGFAAYHAFQSRLSRATTGIEAPAGHQGSWTPNSRLTAQLGPEYRIAGPLGYYSLRPPAGYTLRGAKMDAVDGKSVIYTWSGPLTSDRTAPQFVVMIGSDGGMMTSHLTSAQDVQIGLMSIRRDHRQVASAPIQSGSVHGLSFARSYWKGVGTRTGRRFHGLFYCEIETPNMITISGKDSEPSSRSTLPVFDAAAQSLRLVQRM